MELEAYCMKCRTKRPVQNPTAEYNALGRAVTRGTCPVCGTALYRIGETPAHAHVPKPEGKSGGGKAAAKGDNGKKTTARAGGEKASSRKQKTSTGNKS